MLSDRHADDFTTHRMKDGRSSMTNELIERVVVGGVDTHKLTHHAAVVDAVTGKLLSDQEFPATATGYARMHAWFLEHGEPVRVGIEGTGSYGAGLQRHLQSHGVTVVEVARQNRQERRARGKSDPIDAINAARATLSEAATTIPKDRDGFVETVRLIRTTRRSAVKARRSTINQIHGVLWSAPEHLRRKLGGYDRAALVARCARLRITDTGDDPAATAKRMLRRLACRVQHLDDEIADADAELRDILTRHAPHLMAMNAVGPEAAGQLIATAGENIDRLHSEAALARICGVAPIPASSGNTTRHRLHRGGDRGANSAIHMIVINRLRWHAPTRAYMERRITDGKTKKEIIRCLKRAVIREIYHVLKEDLLTT